MKFLLLTFALILGISLAAEFPTTSPGDPTPPFAYPDAVPRSNMMRNPFDAVDDRDDEVAIWPSGFAASFGGDGVRDSSQMNLLSMAEAMLENNAREEGNEASSSSCLSRDLCELAAAPEAEGGEFDEEEKRALVETVRMLGDALAEMSEDEAALFPTTTSTVAAYTAGKDTGNRLLCQWLFPKKNCRQSEENIQVMGRVTCPATSRVCPALSIGCGLCAILQPDTCGFVCPVFAIYCGTAGYACKERRRRKNSKGRQQQHLLGRVAGGRRNFAEEVLDEIAEEIEAEKGVIWPWGKADEEEEEEEEEGEIEPHEMVKPFAVSLDDLEEDLVLE